MMRSKRIVIDTSIASASGPPNSKKPISSHCRDFLIAVIEICHKVVFTTGILNEWDEHQSRFAKSWLVKMKSRNKLIKLEETSIKKLSRKSRRYIASSDCSEAIEKDILLIEAARSSDMIIASGDDNMRRILKENKEKIPELSRIIWINPCIDEENVIQWLKDGAKIERERYLA